VRHIGEFLCVGFILMDNASKTKITTIMCNHISKSDITEVKLTSRNRKTLEQDYKILEQFFKGFKTYTKTELNLNDSLTKAKYTIIVETAKDTIENFKYRRGEYLAVVKTKEKLEDKLKEVNVVLREEEGMLSVENFTPNEKGETYIACKTSEKGIVEKKGYFVIVNSIGRDIKIPFIIRINKK
jgi:16S rRNA C1402 (ribose-2'-O) methylase RsmI